MLAPRGRSRPRRAYARRFPKSNARAEASRRNGAKSHGPKFAEGKARSAQNALKHGMRAQKHVVLPDEDAAEFAALQAALVEELAPVGALQVVLARRVAVATWRLARADRLAAGTGLGPVAGRKGVGAPFPNQSGDAQPGAQQTELSAERRWDGAGVGVALIRDGNGTRSFETVGGSQHRPWWSVAPTNRYRGAAMAEFMRALRMLEVLQAEQAACAIELPASTPAVQVSRRAPNEPKRRATPRLDYVMPGLPIPFPPLHEPAALWVRNRPESGRRRAAGDSGGRRTNPKPASIGAS